MILFYIMMIYNLPYYIISTPASFHSKASFLCAAGHRLQRGVGHLPGAAKLALVLGIAGGDGAAPGRLGKPRMVINRG